jgi:CHAT domain-containing protein
MQGLYGSLVGRGVSKAAALQSAKQGLLSDPSTAHPFHWAPFVLVGRSD